MAMQLHKIIARRNYGVYSTKFCPVKSFSSVAAKQKGVAAFSFGNPSKLANLPAGLHVSVSACYPLVKPLPLPDNIEDIDAAEKSRFSPMRQRDISGPVILYKTLGSFAQDSITDYNGASYPVDPHLGCYDCSGPVSLNCTMQTNVPEPFSGKGRSIHLNMPGGQWSQCHKWVSQDLHNLHYTNVTRGVNSTGTLSTRQYSTTPSHQQLSSKDKLKRAVKEYGATVIVFHVGMSLLSLGGFYLAVSSGLDVGAMLKSFGAPEIATGASTFVVAYAVHKVFAPVRISITLAATPFIVRYLRGIGFLKSPKNTST